MSANLNKWHENRVNLLAGFGEQPQKSDVGTYDMFCRVFVWLVALLGSLLQLMLRPSPQFLEDLTLLDEVGEQLDALCFGEDENQTDTSEIFGSGFGRG
jgi:hypothetical protein